jgi:hypothetical protein
MHDSGSQESSINIPSAIESARWQPSRPDVTMPKSVLRIIMGNVIVASASGPEEVIMTLQSAWPGRYIIEELSMAGEFLRSGQTCRRWGIAIRKSDGTVELEQELAPKQRCG